MQRFRDLYVEIDDHQNFVKEIAGQTKLQWIRDTKREEEVSLPSSDPMYCFRRDKKDGLDAHLWLTKSVDGDLRVTNIVPLETTTLKMDEYNALLIEFVDTSNLRDIVSKAGGTIKITDDSYTLNDVADEDSAKKLRLFSSAANKSTGYSHPCDMERWLDFIVCVSKAEKKLTVNDMEKYLIEDGWLIESANDLACQYEYSLQLLEAYEDA